jgi:hypothetical protein
LVGVLTAEPHHFAVVLVAVDVLNLLPFEVPCHRVERQGVLLCRGSIVPDPPFRREDFGVI